ncbi:hypothetical protein NESM_000687700 [Novymonas esmeraldas]|uniref:Uncharacterized protein n=1 Tax=Novymonas esmeraldas TaxID=1808958 RepID=A0AAW0EW75_9TRYP
MASATDVPEPGSYVLETVDSTAVSVRVQLDFRLDDSDETTWVVALFDESVLADTITIRGTRLVVEFNRPRRKGRVAEARVVNAFLRAFREGVTHHVSGAGRLTLQSTSHTLVLRRRRPAR